MSPLARVPAVRLPSRMGLILRRFGRNRAAVVGAIGIAALLALALLGPYLLYWKYDDIDPNAFLAPPSAAHLMGTTQGGRDVLALTVRGLGKSMLIGLLVAVLATGLAAIVGASMAYLGGWFERSMLWLIDLILVVPSFLVIAIAAGASIEGDANWLLFVVLLACFAWPLSARMVRVLTLSIQQREFILAARYLGLSAPRIIWRHLLPNVSSLLIIDATLNIGYAIVSEAGLSYFGFGVQAPDTSLGRLIGEGARMATTYSWVFLWPSLVLVLLLLCVNAVGDGLRDALDPASASGRPSWTLPSGGLE